jgi:transposase-like protein
MLPSHLVDKRRSSGLEQNHRRVKRLVKSGLVFGSMHTARQTLAGSEAMAMIKKGQAHQISGRDMGAQTTFVTGLFAV